MHQKIWASSTLRLQKNTFTWYIVRYIFLLGIGASFFRARVGSSFLNIFSLAQKLNPWSLAHSPLQKCWKTNCLEFSSMFLLGEFGGFFYDKVVSNEVNFLSSPCHQSGKTVKFQGQTRRLNFQGYSQLAVNGFSPKTHNKLTAFWQWFWAKRNQNFRNTKKPLVGFNPFWKMLGNYAIFSKSFVNYAIFPKQLVCNLPQNKGDK